MSYAFVFRAYPDVDHMAPLAWKLLEEGEVVHALISPGYDPARDYRLRFLDGYPNLHLHETAPEVTTSEHVGRRLAGARELVRRTLPWALWFVIAHDVQLVVVEWGYGLHEGYERLLSPRGLLSVLRSLVGSVIHRDGPQQLRSNFIVAARLLHRRTVCLPHGLNVKLGVGGPNGDFLPPVDYSDRNRFSVYVLNTEHHREWSLAKASADPAVVQTWGSLRWAPDWFELNRHLAPSYQWPSEPTPGRRLKVVYMVPKWKNLVDKDAALALVKRLQRLESISLAVKAHPRPEGSADPLRDDPAIDWDRLHDVTTIDSVSLITAADVIIDVGSSIGIEVLMQGKVLVNPTYIHGFHTLFDEIDGSCVVARNADEVVAYLERHVAGNPQPATEQARDVVLSHGVYGSQAQPYDVLGTYCERVRALANAPN